MVVMGELCLTRPLPRSFFTACVERVNLLLFMKGESAMLLAQAFVDVEDDRNKPKVKGSGEKKLHLRTAGIRTLRKVTNEERDRRRAKVVQKV